MASESRKPRKARPVPGPAMPEIPARTPTPGSATPQTLVIGGEVFVVIPRAEYDRLRQLAKAETLPSGTPDADGNLPAVEFARASIARSIVRDRAELGLTQRELAELAGIRFESLCRIERGATTPKLATVDAIDRALKQAARNRKPVTGGN
jgi:DNA-binding XRE family transcriptional regulator